MKHGSKKPMWARIRERISKWYYGRWEPFELPVIGGAYQPHWTARIAQAVANFWLKHWQWIIGTCIALVGLVVAVTALKH